MYNNYYIMDRYRDHADEFECDDSTDSGDTTGGQWGDSGSDAGEESSSGDESALGWRPLVPRLTLGASL